MDKKFIRMSSLVALSAMGVTSVNAKSHEKPNVVIIVADDLGWGDVGYHGSVIPTPNIDWIASRGIELDRYYTAPVSSPTRCGLLTGRYPNRFGIRETVIPPWREYGLDENEKTIADVLGENGYDNRAIVGKWHVGHARKAYHPLNRGFTHFYGCLNGALDYFTHERDGELDWHNDWESCYDKGYSTDLIADETVRCIKEYSADGPYFVYTCFNAPHTPIQAPEDEIAELIPSDEFNALKNRDKKGWTYRAMVSRMDKGIGRILDAIRETGDMENTLILFMSDNGGNPGLEPYCNNAPHRGSKFEEWEGGVRNCAAIYWERGFEQGGRKLEQVTGFVDILPTLADIVGADKPDKARPYDGISIYKVLDGSKSVIDRDMYLGVGAAVNNRYKMILSGRSKRLKLENDFFTDIVANPAENDDNNVYPSKEVERLRKVILKGDAIVPSHPELPYEQGRNGFVAPKEWIITKD